MMSIMTFWGMGHRKNQSAMFNLNHLIITVSDVSYTGYFNTNISHYKVL